jgi:hypothetical protein
MRGETHPFILGRVRYEQPDMEGTGRSCMEKFFLDWLSGSEIDGEMAYEPCLSMPLIATRRKHGICHLPSAFPFYAVQV